MNIMTWWIEFHSILTHHPEITIELFRLIVVSLIDFSFDMIEINRVFDDGSVIGKSSDDFFNRVEERSGQFSILSLEQSDLLGEVRDLGIGTTFLPSLVVGVWEFFGWWRVNFSLGSVDVVVG